MRIGAAIKPDIELDIERLLLAGSRLSPLSWGGSDIPEKQALLRGCKRPIAAPEPTPESALFYAIVGIHESNSYPLRQ